MNTTLRRAAFVVLGLSLLLPLRTFAQEPPPGAPKDPLHDEMEAMGHTLRQISKQYSDPGKKTETLALVDALAKHAQTARSLTPGKVEKLTGDDQTKLLDTFHKDLDGVIQEIGVLKQAIAADKTDEAKAEIEKLFQLKQAGHKDLGVGDGHKHGGPPPPPPAPGQ
jgi:soluble cytochrome b562